MDVAYAAGTLVTARGREWVVLPDSEPDMLVLRPLGGSDDELAAIFPALEPVEGAAFPRPEPDDLGDAQAARLLRTALRIGFRSTAGPFRSVAGIAVEPRPYQLVPLLMAIRQPTAGRPVRLAICDDVGIGKTVESGLIAAELLAQGEATGLAVLCSPALAEQWQEELRTKFGIDAELILPSTVTRLDRALGFGETLFAKHRRVVISTDFIKSPRHRDDFLKHCPDLVIVDEAHTCVPADATGSAGGAQQLRYELLRRVAEDKSRHLLLVTATPHSGKDEPFRALLGLLDPALETVNFNEDAGRRQLAQYFVQRRRLDIRRDYPDEAGAFPGDRLFTEAPYKLDPAYRALLDDAVAYARDRVTGATGNREQRIAWWSAIALLRSMVSSPRAAAQTLVTRSQTAAAATADEADELGRPVTADMADDNPDGIDAPPGAETGTDPGAGPEANGNSKKATAGTAPVAASPRLAELADRATRLEGPEKDLKLARLIKVLKDLLKEGYHPIVFCRYIPTAEYVAEHLADAFGRKTLVTAVTGSLSPAQRLDRIDQLSQQTQDSDARRVLVATDCLSEGVNLQHDFNAVVHYDLAWNPTRHEQREGRVDRFGQRAETVKVVTLYGSDNGIDGKVLDVLIRKHREIRRSTGISVPVPDEDSGRVTNAIMEWLLLRDARGDQQALFDLDEVVGQAEKDLDLEWKSMAERESRSRSRFAQGSIHTDEVVCEAAAMRAALGSDDDVAAFTRTALDTLGAVLTTLPSHEFSVEIKSLPPGLQDAIAGLIGERKQVPFRTTPAVPRGEASLSRTDPIVGAVAGFVLSAALDRQLPQQYRQAKRCGVIRSHAVTTRTTLLLVRYRYQLTLPGRYGDVPLIAEEARLLGFTGTPKDPHWLPDEEASGLLRASADANIAPEFARRTIGQALDGLDAVLPEVNRRGTDYAEELRDAHRRVRRSADQAIRGLRVAVAGGADILGVYVCQPFQPVQPGSQP